MKNLKFLWLFCCFIFAGTLTAQETSTIDIIHMKNGSVFRGQITHYTQGGILKIKVNDKIELAFPDNQIKKIIQKEVNSDGIKEIKSRKQYAFRERGVYNLTSGSIAAGKQAWNSENIIDVGFQNITGFKFNRFLGVGLGIGVDYYYGGSGQTVMPIFAEARGYLKEKNVSPMYSLAAGYGIAFKRNDFNITNTKGGLMLHPAIGLRIGGSDNATFIIDLGFKIQHAQFEYDWGWEQMVQRMRYHRFILRTGIMF